MKLLTTMKPTTFALLGVICGLAALQTGCAEHKAAFKDIAPQIPALQPGYARIYLYTVSGRLIQSFKFSVNGRDVGKVNGYECLYIDQLPGPCTVSIDLEGTGLMDTTGFVLAAGDTHYVEAKKDLTITGKVSVASINADQAKSDLDRCEYVGTTPPAMPK